MNRVVLIVLSVPMVLRPAAAYAQRFEVGGGFAWTGGYSVGSVAANETRNPSTGSGALTLFQTDSRASGTPGIDVRVGVHFGSHLLASALFQTARPSLRTHATADFEGAPDVVAETAVSSHLIGAEIEYRVRSGRWPVFAAGGAGQLRDVPEHGDVLTAAEVHGGGGIRYALTHGRYPFGVRADLVASYRSRILTFDGHHVAPRATATVSWRF